jgi:hypothetical protein
VQTRGSVPLAGTGCKNVGMAVRKDCRHYSTRSTGGGDIVQRCRVDAADQAPFACPEGCLFFEARSVSNAGWERFEKTDDGDLWGE